VFSPGDNDQSLHASSESYDSENSDFSNDQPNSVEPVDITGVNNENLKIKDNSDDNVRN
jgi:hypothetical protein